MPDRSVESFIRVMAQVIGNDATITWSGAMGGNLELNLMMPVIAFNLLQSAAIMASACRAFTEKCVGGIRAHEPRGVEQIERSWAMSTAQSAKIGHDEAARIALQAHATGHTVCEIAQNERGMDGTGRYTLESACGDAKSSCRGDG